MPVEAMDSEAETSENFSVHTSLSSIQSSSDDNDVLKRENAFTGKLLFALRTKTVSVKEILNTNVQGKAIVNSYKASKSLTRRSRNLIVEIILTELMNETCRLTNEDFQHLAKAIVKDFPSEAVPTYYIPAIPKNLSRVGKYLISRGKLVDKYRNKLRQLKRIRIDNPLAEITNFQTTESFDPSSDEETS